MPEIYVEVRVFRWNSERDHALPPEVPGIIDRSILAFENGANATSTYERAKRALVIAEEKGLPAMTDAVKPGPKRGAA